MGVPPTIQYASLGMADSLILMVLALVVFGPRRLPQIGRQIGKLMYEFRKASNDFKFQMEEELRNAEEAERRKKEEERLRTMSLAAPAQPAEAVAEEPAEAAPVTYTDPAESPYAYETSYPAVTDGSTVASVPDVTGTPTAVDAPALTDSLTVPRIHPPSTGETVAAERPGAMVGDAASERAEAQPAGEEARQSEPTYYFSANREAEKETAMQRATKHEATMQGSTEVTEQATHNG